MSDTDAASGAARLPSAGRADRDSGARYAMSGTDVGSTGHLGSAGNARYEHIGSAAIVLWSR
eukprot:694944-Rhodomonas_salina.7